MSHPRGEGVQEQAQLLPTKDTLTALKSDVTLESACLELCDNALDAWKRTSDRADSMTIDISADNSGEKTSLVIRDNAGGVSRADAAVLFGLGKTAKDLVPGSIGTYGVGAKKSLVNLGVPFQISSRDVNEPIGWTYRIDQDWFQDDQDWTVPVHDDRNIDPGVTEIQIEDLNYEWDAETESRLRERLGEAYNLFLSDQLQDLHGTTYDLTIRINGEPVDPEGVPAWSFSPFDGLHPRRFENIQVFPPNLDKPVFLNITVGLLQKKDSQNAGTDIYCQKRKVASNLRNEEGGYGGGKDHLGAFSARHERLKVIIELETTGDGQRLPWDTQKSSIDMHNPIMRGTSDSRGVYNWLRRTVRDYYDLDADKVPAAFVEPYGATSDFATNDGRPVVLDYRDRQRVVTSHRPDTDLPQIATVQQRAAAHATLWFSAEDSLEEWQIPAYRIKLEQESDRNVENLSQVSELPPDDIISDPHRAAGKINELGRIHLEHGIFVPDELAPWQRPRYRGYMERQQDTIPSRVDEPPEDVPTDLSEIGAENFTQSTKQAGTIGEVHTGQTADEAAQEELAEIFLVLGGDSETERGAKVIDLSRQELCRLLDIDTDVVDEVLWEQMEMRFQTLIHKDS